MPVRRRISIAMRFSSLRLGAWAALSVVASALLAGSGCRGPEIHTSAHSPEVTETLMPPVPESRELLARTSPRIGEDAIEAGDVLEVTIAARLSAEDIASFPSRVTAEGFLPLPEVGPVFVKGLTLPGAEWAIRQASIVRGLYRDPLVTMIRRTSQPHRVTVLGCVTDAGTYSLPPGSRDVLSAIRAAGGLTDDAGTDVEIMLPKASRAAISNPAVPVSLFACPSEQSSPRTLQIQLMADHGDGIANRPLPHGAIVWVKPRAKWTVEVLGLVHRPGTFEFSPDEDFRLLDAIALAEGSRGPDVNGALIVRRQTEDATPLILHADLRKAIQDPQDNPRLMPGDIIHIEQAPRRPFGQFFRLPWTI